MWSALSSYSHAIESFRGTRETTQVITMLFDDNLPIRRNVGAVLIVMLYPFIYATLRRDSSYLFYESFYS